MPSWKDLRPWGSQVFSWSIRDSSFSILFWSFPLRVPWIMYMTLQWKWDMLCPGRLKCIHGSSSIFWWIIYISKFFHWMVCMFLLHIVSHTFCRWSGKLRYLFCSYISLGPCIPSSYGASVFSILWRFWKEFADARFLANSWISVCCPDGFATLGFCFPCKQGFLGKHLCLCNFLWGVSVCYDFVHIWIGRVEREDELDSPLPLDYRKFFFFQ